jgi:hypothetical protein
MWRANPLIALATLPACSLLEVNAVTSKPSAKTLAGTYTVEHISWLAPKQRNLKKISLEISAGGTFKANEVSSGTWIPAGAGNWEMKPIRGHDLGSRETWGIHFNSPGSSQVTAYWLGEVHAPNKLMFEDPSGNWLFRDYLILKKVEQARKDDGR